MAANRLERSRDLSLDVKSSYYENKLSVSRKYVHIMIFVVGMFNLMLLIPDMVLVNGASKSMIVVVVRVVFSLVLLGVSARMKYIGTFKEFSILITVCELLAFIIFIFVLSQYNDPNFLIQTMGLITITIAIFLVPNRWTYMLAVAVLEAVGFFIFSAVFIKSASMVDFCAAVVYLSITILLCAISARNTENHQFMEFVTKSELEHMSSTDYLTNTANRFKIVEEADRWIEFCHRQKFPLSLVFVDVDNLKRINDRYGHSFGDSVLANVAKLIRDQLRASDIIARWGGDEFVVLLPNVALDNTIALTERIRNVIAENAFTKDLGVTCSLGFAVMKEDSSFENLIHEADKFMYRAKKLGKNNVQWSK